MLNLRLMSRWENWITIILMVLIASFAFNALSKIILGNGVTDNG